MEGYSNLANFYDVLTGNVDYAAIHSFYRNVFKRFDHKPRILLDLACGTGTLSFEFEKDGCEVIGTDSSEDMLTKAMETKFDVKSNVLFLNQAASELDLYGTVDTVVCNLDAVNHFDPREIGEIFRRVALFTEPNGLFVFDINSRFKFENILNDACYFYDDEEVFCAWSSTYDGTKADIHLDIFERVSEDEYFRREENITEYYYSVDHITSLLNANGFDVLSVTSDYSDEKPNDNSQRIHFTARKKVI